MNEPRNTRSEILREAAAQVRGMARVDPQVTPARIAQFFEDLADASDIIAESIRQK